MKYEDTLKEETKTWCIEDGAKRNEKITREIVRYPKLLKEMGVTLLDTSNMIVIEVGGGPVGVISKLPVKDRYIYDPLTEEYRKYWPCWEHINCRGEEAEYKFADLIVISNALDHCEDPDAVMRRIKDRMKPGAYLAIHSAINNAITNPHLAHIHNINPEWLHNWVDEDFETVHELTYEKEGLRYGWKKYNGKVGQPAFAGLYRKTTGY